MRSGGVSDSTPPPAPRSVTAKRNDDGSVTVEWEADADLESGVRCFVIERDGVPIRRRPKAPTGAIRPPALSGVVVPRYARGAAAADGVH